MIFNKIWPQKDGVPIYNPNGRYWVKLFAFGKYRKIEIDDRMPCNKYNTMLMPKTEAKEELWAPLLAKALLKLNSFKFRSTNYYEEVGEVSAFTALTGYLGEKIMLKKKENEKLFNYLCREKLQNNKNLISFVYKSSNRDHTIYQEDKKKTDDHSSDISRVKRRLTTRNAMMPDSFKKKLLKSYSRKVSVVSNTNIPSINKSNNRLKRQ